MATASRVNSSPIPRPDDHADGGREQEPHPELGSQAAGPDSLSDQIALDPFVPGAAEQRDQQTEERERARQRRGAEQRSQYGTG